MRGARCPRYVRVLPLRPGCGCAGPGAVWSLTWWSVCCCAVLCSQLYAHPERGMSNGAGQPTPQPISPPSKNSVFASFNQGSADGGSEHSGQGDDARGHGSPVSTVNLSDMGHTTHTVSVEEESFFTRKQQTFPPTLFDRLELMVWESVTHSHQEAFLQSAMFKQYQQFVFLSKKPVTEDDFTLFRVLGRGGFGQVNGESGGRAGGQDARVPWFTRTWPNMCLGVIRSQVARDVKPASCTP
jgi:hypothetical protein